VSTTLVISASQRLMHYDLKISGARIRTHDLWIRMPICYYSAPLNVACMSIQKPYSCTCNTHAALYWPTKSERLSKCEGTTYSRSLSVNYVAPPRFEPVTADLERNSLITWPPSWEVDQAELRKQIDCFDKKVTRPNGEDSNIALYATCYTSINVKRMVYRC